MMEAELERVRILGRGRRFRLVVFQAAAVGLFIAFVVFAAIGFISVARQIF